MCDFLAKYTNFSSSYIETMYKATEGYTDIYSYENHWEDKETAEAIVDVRRDQAAKVGNNYVYEFIFTPNDSFLNSNKPLLPNVELKLSFDRLPAQFSSLHVEKPVDDSVSPIKDTVLTLKKVYAVADYVSSTSLRHHFDTIEYQPITYDYDEIQATVKNLPTGEQYIRVHNITGGNTPDYVFCGVCPSSATNGSFAATSTAFRVNDVKKIDITLNGSSVNGYPLTIEHNRPIWPYLRLQDILSRTCNVDQGEQMSMTNFKVNINFHI